MTKSTPISDHSMHTISARLFDRAINAPNNRAVTDKDRTLTNLQLAREVLSLTAYLNTLELKPQSRIGVYLARCNKLVASYIAINHLCHVIVPLNIDHPDSVIQQRANLAQLDAVITADATQTIFDLSQIININDIAQIDLPQNIVELRQFYLARQDALDQSHLAYILFTSGSTGTPKGVKIATHALCRHMSWKNNTYPVCAYPIDTNSINTEQTFSRNISSKQASNRQTSNQQVLNKQENHTTATEMAKAPIDFDIH